MRKLSTYKGKEAVEIIAALVEPATTIMGDPKVRDIINEPMGKPKAIKYALQKYSNEVLMIMGALEGVDVDDEEAFNEYKEEVNFFTLPKNILDLFSDPDLQNLFFSQEQTEEATPSTPASESMPVQK